MNGHARRAVLGTIAVAVLRAASVLGDSSCLSAKSAEDCRSQIEEGTGDQCVWCSCLAIPSECLGASLAKVCCEAEQVKRLMCLPLRVHFFYRVSLVLWLGRPPTCLHDDPVLRCFRCCNPPAHRRTSAPQRRSVRATIAARALPPAYMARCCDCPGGSRSCL